MLKPSYLILALLLGLNGCIYKMDIHQGNVLDIEQIEKLETGMSMREVIDLLGSPQLTDPFHTQRWDYYSMSNTKNQRNKIESRLTLHFEGEQLREIVRQQPAPEKPKEEKLLW